MIAGLRHLGRDEKGASVIELGLFAPILAVMLMGVTDMSMGYARKLAVEQATFRALERVQLGTVQTDYSFVRTEAATAAGVPASQVTLDTWRECNRVRQSTWDGVCNTGEELTRYVKVTINTTYTPRFDYGPFVTGSNGTIPIVASSTVRVQ